MADKASWVDALTKAGFKSTLKNLKVEDLVPIHTLDHGTPDKTLVTIDPEWVETATEIHEWEGGSFTHSLTLTLNNTSLHGALTGASYTKQKVMFMGRTWTIVQAQLQVSHADHDLWGNGAIAPSTIGKTSVGVTLLSVVQAPCPYKGVMRAVETRVWTKHGLDHILGLTIDGHTASEDGYKAWGCGSIVVLGGQKWMVQSAVWDTPAFSFTVELEAVT